MGTCVFSLQCDFWIFLFQPHGLQCGLNLTTLPFRPFWGHFQLPPSQGVPGFQPPSQGVPGFHLNKLSLAFFSDPRTDLWQSAPLPLWCPCRWQPRTRNHPTLWWLSRRTLPSKQSGIGAQSMGQDSAQWNHPSTRQQKTVLLYIAGSRNIPRDDVLADIINRLRQGVEKSF